MNCSICKRVLNNLDDPFSLDCGGDCEACMAYIAEDPDCIVGVKKLLAEGKVDIVKYSNSRKDQVK